MSIHYSLGEGGGSLHASSGARCGNTLAHQSYLTNEYFILPSHQPPAEGVAHLLPMSSLN